MELYTKTGDASFELLALRASDPHGAGLPRFQLESYSVTTVRNKAGGKRADGSQATVKVKVGRRRVMSAAEGVGPVHALDGALRKALLKFLSACQLHASSGSYKVRVVNNRKRNGRAGAHLDSKATDQAAGAHHGARPAHHPIS